MTAVERRQPGPWRALAALAAVLTLWGAGLPLLMGWLLDGAAGQIGLDVMTIVWEGMQRSTGLGIAGIAAAWVAAVGLLTTGGLALGALLDGQGETRAAFGWALDPRSSSLPCLAVVAGAFAAALASMFSDEVSWSTLIATGVLVPFIVQNPRTVERAAPLQWWRPMWPGWRAVAFGGVVMVVEHLWGEASTELRENLAMILLGYVAIGLSSIFGTLLWLRCGDWRQAGVDFARVFRPQGFRALVAFHATSLVAIAALALPFLGTALVALYLAPQFAAAGGHPTATVLGDIGVWVAEGPSSWVLLMGLSLPLGFAATRLLFRLRERTEN